MLNWGIIGAGNIARVFCNAMRFSRLGQVVAVASQSQERAALLAKDFSIPKGYTGYEALLADEEVQVVYISTLHPEHAEWAIKAAEARKHLLVEKPIAMNYPEAAAIIDAARANDVFLMEAFMYRCHPQSRKLVELVRDGAIGRVHLIRAAFSYNADYDEKTRYYANDKGGGGILDVGGYVVSMARLIAGAADGEPFSEPSQVKGCAQIGPTGVDHYAAATLEFENGIIAEIIAGVGCRIPWEVSIYGDRGALTVPNPWIPSSPCRTARMPLPSDTIFPPAKVILNTFHDDSSQEIVVPVDRDLYAIEADTVAENLPDRQAPAMDWEDTLGNMRLLDRWREEVGLIYNQEKHFHPRTIANRSLRRSSKHNMHYGKIPGLGKPVSRLVHGADHNVTVPFTEVMFDHFFELGGNCFDTSHGYHEGRCERNLGDWIRSRNIRNEVVVVEKGGNPPNGTPEGLTRELLEGLDRLGMDSVDIFLMHRDNPDIPVGEILAVMNEYQKAGRMTIFGVSNWSLPRLIESKVYAERMGLNYFSVVSNQFSLSRILDAWWNRKGNYQYWASCSDSDFRRWFEETQMVLMPWSSQASGFFLEKERKGPDEFDLVRCWYSKENLERRERATKLARMYGVELVNIALAWVLCQKFPVFPIIGPLHPDETRSCMRALDIKLSEEEMRWLNLES